MQFTHFSLICFPCHYGIFHKQFPVDLNTMEQVRVSPGSLFTKCPIFEEVYSSYPMKNLLLILILGILLPDTVFAQCCGAMAGGMGTAGARFGLGTAGPRSLQLYFAYDMNYMNGLYDGDERIMDNDRQRMIHSSILEANYGISRRLSVAAILPYVFQEIASTRVDGSRQVDYLWGFGDLVMMIKYRFLNPLAYNGWEIAGGIGPKLPLGSYSYSGSEGYLFPMDIQPGSGSVDGISWLSLSKSHLFVTNLYLSSGAIFRLSGKNRNYRDSLIYSFGNEFQYSGGVSYSFYKGLVFDLFNYVRYRYQAKDFICDEPAEMTGGHWLFVSPGFRINITPDLWVVATADFPLYSKLEGPQLATSYRFSAAIAYTFSSRRITELKPDQ